MFDFCFLFSELMAAYIAMINSAVHVVMYTYYCLSSFRTEKLQKIIKLIKPLITIMQLAQFVVIIVHCTVAIWPTCNASFFFDVQIFNFVLLMILFGKFFVQSYLTNDKKLYPVQA